MIPLAVAEIWKFDVCIIRKDPGLGGLASNLDGNNRCSESSLISKRDRAQDAKIVWYTNEAIRCGMCGDFIVPGREVQK